MKVKKPHHLSFKIQSFVCLYYFSLNHLRQKMSHLRRQISHYSSWHSTFSHDGLLCPLCFRIIKAQYNSYNSPTYTTAKQKAWKDSSEKETALSVSIIPFLWNGDDFKRSTAFIMVMPQKFWELPVIGVSLAKLKISHQMNFEFYLLIYNQ